VISTLESDAPDDAIAIHGAREHNLKNISVQIPRGKFVVVTGVSGSGKSTLAFDLLFAEGQRRFLDAMSAYARQFVEQMSRPDVDLITGIPPTVSIEQRTSRGGGKSTVATVTEIYHFLRLLFAKLGTTYCPDCQLPVEGRTRDQVGAALLDAAKERGDLLLLAPVIRGRKGFHSEVAIWAAKHGYEEIRADGMIHRTDEPFRLDRFKDHDVEIVAGVLEGARRGRKATPAKAPNIAGKSPQQLVDDALKIGQGTVLALDSRGTVTVHSTERTCPQCAKAYPPLDPKNFSYNSVAGWCPKCRGFGELFELPDVDRGARADAIEESWFGWTEGEHEECPECHGARLGPVARAVRLKVGQASSLPRAAHSTGASTKTKRAGKMPALPLAATEPTIDFFAQCSVDDAFAWFEQVTLEHRDAEIARDILPEIRERLKFLREVGLGYLQMGRGVRTLSGGESQRIRLAAQLGSNLSGVLYVLDEPTIGLHSRDNEQLIRALTMLKNRGNSLVVVEHDEETMMAADYVIDLGPAAGVNGGEVVAAGTLKQLMAHTRSVTGNSLKEATERKFPSRGERRKVGQASSPTRATKEKKGTKGDRQDACPTLSLTGASVNNLKDVAVEIPLNRFVVVTGVSGSGKSTLIKECLLPALEAAGTKTKTKDGSVRKALRVTGRELIRNIHEVDQAPIGRTPRSTPATYVGFFNDIRELFAQVPEARMRGYTASRFSFNSAVGRCPVCEGAGQIKLEMNFLPPAFVRCEACGGARFNRDTLDVEYAGKNIAQVMELSVAEAIEFFSAFQRIKRPLEALRDTGLDYLKLGQTSPTLSGGEAQRMKLVTHLLGGLKPGPDKLKAGPKSKVQSPTVLGDLFVLEEPTIGLHMSDVRKLVEVLQRLVDAGHSVVVIEHNMDLIAEADWVIDLGPEAGAAGGELVVVGTPEQVAACKASHTGRFLNKTLGGVGSRLSSR
jgi:excinuclease ABC subunit A